MTCNTVDVLLPDFIDGNLDGSDAQLVSDHHGECPACRQKYQDALFVIEALKDFRAPPASAGFADRVIRNATKSGAPPVRGILPYVGAGIAASFIFLFILVSAIISPDINNQSLSIVAIGDEVKTIKLAIESAHRVDGIKMSIDVSESLEISGYPDQTNISWNTRLEKGTNIIALPISAIARGDGEITTRVHLNGREKVFKIKIRYQALDNTTHNQQAFVNA